MNYLLAWEIKSTLFGCSIFFYDWAAKKKKKATLQEVSTISSFYFMRIILSYKTQRREKTMGDIFSVQYIGVSTPTLYSQCDRWLWWSGILSLPSLKNEHCSLWSPNINVCYATFQERLNQELCYKVFLGVENGCILPQTAWRKMMSAIVEHFKGLYWNTGMHFITWRQGPNFTIFSRCNPSSSASSVISAL